jgi:hypothetical protein
MSKEKIKIFEVKDRFDVFNHKKDYLGEIGYWAKWKCWIWKQDSGVIMSSECLEIVVNKLKELDKKKLVVY